MLKTPTVSAVSGMRMTKYTYNLSAIACSFWSLDEAIDAQGIPITTGGENSQQVCVLVASIQDAGNLGSDAGPSIKRTKHLIRVEHWRGW